MVQQPESYEYGTTGNTIGTPTYENDPFMKSLGALKQLLQLQQPNQIVEQQKINERKLYFPPIIASVPKPDPASVKLIGELKDQLQSSQETIENERAMRQNVERELAEITVEHHELKATLDKILAEREQEQKRHDASVESVEDIVMADESNEATAINNANMTTIEANSNEKGPQQEAQALMNNNVFINESANESAVVRQRKVYDDVADLNKDSEVQDFESRIEEIELSKEENEMEIEEKEQSLRRIEAALEEKIVSLQQDKEGSASGLVPALNMERLKELCGSLKNKRTRESSIDSWQEREQLQNELRSLREDHHNMKVELINAQKEIIKVHWKLDDEKEKVLQYEKEYPAHVEIPINKVGNDAQVLPTVLPENPPLESKGIDKDSAEGVGDSDLKSRQLVKEVEQNILIDLEKAHNEISCLRDALNEVQEKYEESQAKVDNLEKLQSTQADKDSAEGVGDSDLKSRQLVKEVEQNILIDLEKAHDEISCLRDALNEIQEKYEESQTKVDNLEKLQSTQAVALKNNHGPQELDAVEADDTMQVEDDHKNTESSIVESKENFDETTPSIIESQTPLESSVALPVEYITPLDDTRTLLEQNKKLVTVLKNQKSHLEEKVSALVKDNDELKEKTMKQEAHFIQQHENLLTELNQKKEKIQALEGHLQTLQDDVIPNLELAIYKQLDRNNLESGEEEGDDDDDDDDDDEIEEVEGEDDDNVDDDEIEEENDIDNGDIVEEDEEDGEKEVDVIDDDEEEDDNDNEEGEDDDENEDVAEENDDVYGNEDAEGVVVINDSEDEGDYEDNQNNSEEPSPKKQRYDDHTHGTGVNFI